MKYFIALFLLTFSLCSAEEEGKILISQKLIKNEVAIIRQILDEGYYGIHPDISYKLMYHLMILESISEGH